MTLDDTPEVAPTENGNARRTTRKDWIDTAKDILVGEGVEKLKVMNLAQRLNVSRSSFYWFFKNREDLLAQLLHDWEHRNTASIVERAARPSESIADAVLNIFECWVDELAYDPGLDFAVREWARRSPEVRTLVDRADETRVMAITEMFRRHDYEETEAFIRARILYFMQIGYYALEMHEPLDQRLSYVGAYIRSFTGQDASTRLINRFRAFAKAHAASPEN